MTATLRRRIRKALFSYAPTLIKTGLLVKAPRLYSRLEIHPTSCILMLTNRCNLQCVMCGQWRKAPGSDELSREEWEIVITDLKNNGIRNIHFSGGEPLLRKDDLRHLISHCYNNGFTVGMTTNGTRLSGAVLDDLIDAGLRSIVLSIDALGPAYEKIRGTTQQCERLEKIAFLISEKKKKRGIDAYINFTLMKNTIKEFKKVKTFADTLKIPVAVCLLDKSSSIFDVKENKKEFWIDEEEDKDALGGLLAFLKEEKNRHSGSLFLNYPMIDFIGNYFRDPRQRAIPCVSSQDRIIIDPYGNLLGGCMSMGSFGNIRNRPFKDLKNRESYRRAKKKMFYKECKGCSCGYQFNIRCFPTLVAKDLFDRMKRFLFNASRNG